MKKRKEGFFGLHFDFHAGKTNADVGGRTTPAMIQRIIDIVHPDYIQCDCKGHAGYSSYKTKAGNPTENIANDALLIWRDVAHNAGIPLIMHYSGVFDCRAIELHPEYARICEDGSRDKDKTSTFGKYVDELLIPQLVELAVDIGVDGVWVDGECWSTAIEYNPEVIAKFQSDKGFILPKLNDGSYDKNSAEFQRYKNYCRQQFFNYLQHYCAEVHKSAPNFEIASNWAFSSHIPEPVCVDVDFLSGDFSPSDSYNTARFEGRCLSRQGLNWDLMAWGFFHSWGGEGYISSQSLKSDVTLMREGAAVIALGGGYQIYTTQLSDGAVKSWELDTLGSVAKFVREREQFARQKPIAVDAVLYAKSDVYSRGEMFISGGQTNIHGAVRAILDGGRPVDVITEAQLLGNLEGRKTVIVPDIGYLSDEIISALKKFAQDGGSLILTGSATMKYFEDISGIRVKSYASGVARWLGFGGRMCGQGTNYADVELCGATALEYNYSQPDFFPECRNIAAAVNSYGKGKVYCITYDIFNRYYAAPTFLARDFIKSILCMANPSPVAWLESGIKAVDITPATKDGKTVINLINTTGIYAESRVHTYDEIAPLYNLRIGYRCDKAPVSVTEYPSAKALNFTYNDGAAIIDVDRLDIHSAIVIE